MRWLVVFALATALHAADAPPKNRLNEVQDVQPIRYRAELTLDPAKTTFSGATLDPDLAGMVLAVYAFYGDRTAMERLLAEFAKTGDKHARQNIVTATTYFRDPAAIELGMNAVASGSIPFLEGERLLFNGGKDASTRGLALKFLQANLDKITSIMPAEGDFNFGSILPNVGSAFCDAPSRDELKTFFQPLVSRYMGAPRTLDQNLEAIDLCIANKAAQARSVAEFLAKY